MLTGTGNMRRYNLVLLSGMMGALLAIALVHIIVDPYGLWGLVERRGFNAQKTYRIYGGVRVESSMRLWRHQYEVLFLGSSRVKSTIDPARTAIGDGSVANVGLPETRLSELVDVIRFVEQHQHPRRVIIGLDFYMLNAHRRAVGDYRSSAFSGRDPWLVMASQTLSLTGLRSSLTTVLDNLRGRPAATAASGYRHRPLVSPNHRYEEAFDRTLRGSALVKPSMYACYVEDRKATQAFDAAVLSMAATGVDIDIFIPPVHALQLEVIELLGLSGDFWAWKRRLVALVDRAAARLPHSQVRLWDFTDYNATSTETVGPQMRWHWESAHVKVEVGTRVVDQMLTGDPSSELGVQLTAANIAQVERGFATRRQRWIQAQPDQVAALRDMFIQTQAEREERCRRARATAADAVPPHSSW